MGAIWYRRIEFVATISELVGYKAGLALSREEIIGHVPAFQELFAGADDGHIRIRAEEVEELFGNLLFALGAVSSPDITTPGIPMYHRYKESPDKLALWMALLELFPEWTKQHKPRPFLLHEFVTFAENMIGPEGALMAIEFIEEIVQSSQKQPWNAYRRVEWKDVRDLSELFQSAELSSPHGHFFDQRFIDYLDANFAAIDKIHWRQFEGLTAEFFGKAGFKVQLGPGRDDDSVDIRLWCPDDPSDNPPIIIIQCKRERRKIGKVVVKALWADVTSEKAASGLIVTTNALSRGARKVCIARSYPVLEANRKMLRAWIQALRTPNTGVFLGE